MIAGVAQGAKPIVNTMNLAFMFFEQGVVRRAFHPTHPKKLLFFVLADAAITCGSLVSAFLIRFDFTRSSSYYALVPRALPLFLGVKIVSFWFFQLYTLSWRFVSLRDLANIAKAIVFSSLALAAIIYPFHIEAFAGFPRGVLLIDGILTLVAIATLRIAKRVALEVVRSGRSAESGKRTIIVGAGNTGEMVLRDIQRTQYAAYAPVAFLDDDPNLIGSHLHGVRVRGGLDDLAAFIRTLRAEAVIVAIQSIGHQRLRALHRAARDAGAQVKIVPRLYDVHAPQVRLQAIEDITIEDLIRREPIRVDEVAIRRAIAGKAVLITGAAGSIGSEIVRQVCRYGPRTLTCLEVDETDLHRMQLALGREFRGLAERISYVIGDIRDADRVDEVFTRYRPDVVYHAAAYKHVPMMESNVAEAVKANIVGTWNVAEAARRVGTERFVLISTDKAVRPTSVMGATKRIAEQIGRACGTAGGRTEFVAVRFGNVLGSRGSVLPIFLEQLKRGGPLTITHQDMRRYFMTIPEAVALVLEAGVIGRGGDVLVLDMGDPVRIVAFAEELIRLHRLRPYEDIGIEYIGIRPGEKLFEEILTAEEGTIATKHEKIYVARSSERYDHAGMASVVQRFGELARLPDVGGHAIRQLLRERIEWYAPGVEQQHASLPAAPLAHAAVPTHSFIRERA